MLPQNCHFLAVITLPKSTISFQQYIYIQVEEAVSTSKMSMKYETITCSGTAQCRSVRLDQPAFSLVQNLRISKLNIYIYMYMEVVPDFNRCCETEGDFYS
jgi:hypothetical protein